MPSLDWEMQIASVCIIGFFKEIVCDRLSAGVSILPQISLMGLSLRLWDLASERQKASQTARAVQMAASLLMTHLLSHNSSAAFGKNKIRNPCFVSYMILP